MTVFAAAAVAGIAMAADSNVVGYTQVAPYDTFGTAWAGQNFVQCGDGAIKLTEMLDASTLEYGDTIQFWDREDVVFNVYAWNGVGWEDTDLNQVGLDIPDIDIPNGIGVLLQTVNPVALAGQVSTNLTEVSLSEGLNLTSSLFPVPVDLSKCDFSALDYGDTIQVWDTVEFVWVVYAWNGVAFEDTDLEEVTGVIAQPGEAFFVGVANNTSYTQTPPSL